MAGDFDFASTTFGSIAPDDVEEGDWLIYNGFKSWGFVVHVTKVHFLYGCAAMDLLGVFLFFVVMFFFRRRQKAIVKSVDEDSIEISDYSVAVRGLPENATDKEEVRCFFELKFGKVVDAVLAKKDYRKTMDGMDDEENLSPVRNLAGTLAACWAAAPRPWPPRPPLICSSS